MIDNYIGEKPKGLGAENINKFTFVTGKVIDVILDSKHVDFKKLGSNGGLGAIKYEILDDTPTKNKNVLTYALPLFPHFKRYPLKGESVVILNGVPTVKSGNKNVTTFSYYLTDVNLFNTPHLNLLGKPYTPNTYFKEKSEYHPLFALEGDTIFEGRNNQSIRFTSDKNGYSKIVFRATNNIPKQADKTSFIEENVNIDDTTIIFSTKGKVPIDVAYGKLSSYSINITKPSNSIVKAEITNAPTPTVSNNQSDINNLTPVNNIKIAEKEKEIFQINLYEEATVTAKRIPSNKEQDDFVVPEFTFVESDKLGLEIIPAADPDAFKQVLFDLFGNDENGNISLDYDTTPDASNIRVSNQAPITAGQFEAHLGGITESRIPIQSKAMLEVIAFCEGTMGRGQNGYDVRQQIPYTNQIAFIADWDSSPNYSKGHPSNSSIMYKSVKSGKIEYVQLLSSASGRYQFITGTWNNISALTKFARFTKSSQDINCDYLLKKTLGDNTYKDLNNIMLLNNRSIVASEKVMERLSAQWDSFPYGNSIYSYHTLFNVPEGKKRKCRFTMDTVRDLYRRAYNFYLNQPVQI